MSERRDEDRILLCNLRREWYKEVFPKRNFISICFIALLVMTSISHKALASPSRQSDIAVRKVAWDPTGKLIAAIVAEGPVGDSGERVELYNASGQSLGAIPNFIEDDEHKLQGIIDLSWSLDGTRLAIGKNGIGAGNPIIEIWDVSSLPYERILRYVDLEGSTSQIRVAWRPNQAQIAYTRRYGVIGVLDLDLVRVVHSFGAKDASVTSLKWSPDGELLFSGQEGNIWDVDEDTLVGTLNQDDYGEPFAWSPDGTQIALLYEKQIRIWNTATLQPEITLNGEVEFTREIYWVGQRIFSENSTREYTLISIWDSSTHQLIAPIEVDASFSMATFAISPDGQKVVVGLYGSSNFPSSELIQIITIPH